MNIFDQNRFSLLVGHRFSQNFRIEGGYLSHIAQLARQVNGKNVFQYNNGFMLNAYFNVQKEKKLQNHNPY